MKPKIFILGVLGVALSVSLHAESTLEPVVIDGLNRNVYRSLQMTRAWTKDGKVTIDRAEHLMTSVMIDDRIDEAEAKLLATLSAGKFSIIARALPELKINPSEIALAGEFSAAAREKFKSIAPEDFRVWLSERNADNLMKLGKWAETRPDRRAQALALIEAEIDEAWKRQPAKGNEWGHYRDYVTRWSEDFERAGLAPDLKATGEGLTLTSRPVRLLVYEAFLLHDRRNGDRVPDFLYSWLMRESDARRRVEKNVSEALGETGASQKTAGGTP